MKKKIIRDQRGIALLMTITIVTLVVVASFELNRSVRSAVVATANTRDRLALSEIAAAGVHAAMALLVRDKMTSAADSIQEDWSNTDKISELLQEISFEEGRLSIAIRDERSRLQVNALVTGPGGRQFNDRQLIVWERLLEWYKTQGEVFEEIEPTSITNSLKDWMDSGDDDAITGLSGAESDYYEDLESPYECRNGPFQHPDEMLRVKDIIPELFYGIEETPGLIDMVTVHGIQSTENSETLQWDGKININTADLPVLISLLPPEAEDLAEAIIEYRVETEDEKYLHDLSNSNWYKEVPGMGDTQINSELLTTTSDIYRIITIAFLNEIRMKVTAVVQREQQKKTGKWICKVLSWNAE